MAASESPRLPGLTVWGERVVGSEVTSGHDADPRAGPNLDCATADGNRQEQERIRLAAVQAVRRALVPGEIRASSTRPPRGAG